MTTIQIALGIVVAAIILTIIPRLCFALARWCARKAEEAKLAAMTPEEQARYRASQACFRLSEAIRRNSTTR